MTDRSHTGSTRHGFWMCRSEVCDFRGRRHHVQNISNERKRQKRKQEIRALLVNQLLIDLEKWRILK